MIKRDIVYAKFQGKCAYTGRPLGEDWQVDHCTSKVIHSFNVRGNWNENKDFISEFNKVHNIENLMPALRIVNHYKRSFDLEGFRQYMLHFHTRLAKYPKNPKKLHTIKRKEYIQSIADAFGISADIPFSGKFYFETLPKND